MIEDDDIPVLTQILRTGGARDGRGSAAPSSTPLAEPEVAQDGDVRPAEPASSGDPLVIGNAPHVDAVAADDASFDDDDDAHDPARYAVTDETPTNARADDSFRLPQDHDQAAAAEAHGTRLDEPEIRSDASDRPTVVAVAGPYERRVNPFVSEEPRERRHESGDVSLQRLASITSSVRDSVLVALQTRIDTELDARIAQAMHREVETAIAQLQDKLRDGLTHALRDVVARAVDDEMTRFVAAERDATARLDPRKPPIRFDA